VEDDAVAGAADASDFQFHCAEFLHRQPWRLHWIFDFSRRNGIAKRPSQTRSGD